MPIGVLRDYGLIMHQGVDVFYFQVLDQMTSLHFDYLEGALSLQLGRRTEHLKKKIKWIVGLVLVQSPKSFKYSF